MKKEMMAALAIAGLALTACGGSSGNKAVDDALGQRNLNDKAALAGKDYTSECQNRLLDVVKVGSQTVAYKFDSNNHATRTTRYFSDNGCQKQSFEMTEQGDWSGYEKLNDNSDNAKIDIHWTTATVKPLEEASGLIVGAMNVANVCGVKTWAVNEQVDVSKNSGSCPFVEKVPADQFDIVHLNTDKGELTFGQGLNKSNKDARPTEIDKAVIYKRK